MLNNMKIKIVQKVSPLAFKVKSKSPTILMGVGTVSVIAGSVLACKATLKVDGILDEAKEKFAKIEQGKEKFSEETYSKEDYLRDKAITYVQTGVALGRNYLAPAALILFGMGCMWKGHNILRGRNLALMAAYKAVDTSFKRYKENVIELLGPDADEKASGVVTEEIKVRNEEGKTEKEVVKYRKLPSGISEYGRVFDFTSPVWKDDIEDNYLFLRGSERYLNDLLVSRGHVFLNEVYDQLGFPRTKAGQVVGWTRGGKDKYISFGMYDFVTDPARADFINGYASQIILDFNVDGVIYDQI